MSNPRWVRDEVIVLLDFYHRHFPSIPNSKSAEIKELSTFLRDLCIMLGKVGDKNLRNPNGIYMQLMHFHHLNPVYQGKGFTKTSKLERAVWKEFKNSQQKLQKIAANIQSVVDHGDPPPVNDVDDDTNIAVPEGLLLTRLHRYRERDPKIVKLKKEWGLDTYGHLACESCDFNYQQKYGELGQGFIECHHQKPIAELTGAEETNIEDLSLVCSNCHRMIHRRKPWLSMKDLKALLT